MMEIQSAEAASPTIVTSHLFTLRADIGASFDAGDGPLGRRVLNTAARGTFHGARLRGELVAGSADWMLIRHDEARVIDARVALRTHDGAIIHMSYGGRFIAPPDVLAEMARDRENRHLIDPARYYMRTTPTFETGAPAYAWLNDAVCVARGWLVEGGGLAYAVHQVL